MNHKERVALIYRDHPDISISRQAELLDISRSSIYWQPAVDAQDIRIMNAIDEMYTKYPFYGSRRIKHDLETYDIHVCREKVQSLMRAMGLEAVYPKPRINTSISDNSARKYPYLLSGLTIHYPNHVWGTDITYVRLETGWAYLTALMDWFSRYVLAWELSSSLDTSFCIAALTRALEIGTPNIHNSDQGKQFTDHTYAEILKARAVRISMDGRGRYLDNIFTERLWRSVKYENIYLKSYRDIGEARLGLQEYFEFYNTKRKHQSLNYRTPDDVYFNHEKQDHQNFSKGQITIAQRNSCFVTI